MSERPTRAMNACDELLSPSIDSGNGAVPALIYRERSYSYSELAILVDRFGFALRRAGVGRGDRVLFLLKDTPELVAGYLAAMKIGGVAVALNTRLAAGELRYALDDSACRVLFIHREFLDTYRKCMDRDGARTPVLVLCDPSGAALAPAIGLNDFLADQSDHLASVPMAPDDMAFWIYTSGTTGKPKAVVHRHRDVLLGDRHLGEVLGVKRGDRVYSSSKLFFAFALGHCLLGGLRVGATLILHDGWPDSAAVAGVVAQHRPDFMFSVPTVYRNLLRDGHAKGDAFRRVRCYVSAGEMLPEPLFERWRQATGKPILEGIGATETIFLTIANTPAAYRAGSTGRQQPGVELQLRDERGRPFSEPGRSGILWVRMGSLFSGYWNEPEKTRATLDNGWYRTGDIFSVDPDGWWHHHGRCDEMLKISGQWVSPLEIEDCVLGAPGVVDAAVVGVPNSDGLVRLSMFVVPVPTAPEDLRDRLQESIKARLSIYKCPRNIRFIDEIPRTATGKVQRFRLRELAATSA